MDTITFNRADIPCPVQPELVIPSGKELRDLFDKYAAEMDSIVAGLDSVQKGR